MRLLTLTYVTPLLPTPPLLLAPCSVYRHQFLVRSVMRVDILLGTELRFAAKALKCSGHLFFPLPLLFLTRALPFRPGVLRLSDGALPLSSGSPAVLATFLWGTPSSGAGASARPALRASAQLLSWGHLCHFPCLDP